MLHHQDFIQLGQNFVGHILRLILFSYLFSLSCSLVELSATSSGLYSARTEFCWTYITPDPLLIPPHLNLLIFFTSGFTSGAYVCATPSGLYSAKDRILLDIYYT